VHASAFTLHQVVTALRTGQFEDAAGSPLEFEQVVLVGHSFGSNISWTEASLYQDVDALVLTGISHDQNPPGAVLTQTLAYPAELDPLFADLALPPGYLTTIPGARDELFYYVPGASFDTISADEALKDTVPLGMLFDQFTTYGYTQSIEVPVLNIVGNYDTLACQLPSCLESGSIDGEGEHYQLAAAFEQWIVDDAGHSLNLHENAPSWYSRAQHWLKANLSTSCPPH
jgi:pimeloyl-ACP methyl ester carboxylesterase